MYTLYTLWVICDPEMNFEVMPVKGYARIEAATHKTCSLDAKFKKKNRKKIRDLVNVTKNLDCLFSIRIPINLIQHFSPYTFYFANFIYV